MKKLFLVVTILLFFTSLSFLFIKQVNAQTASFSPQQNQHVWVQSITIDVLSSIMCLLAGVDPAGGGKQCLGYNTQNGQLGFYQGGNGAIGTVGNLIAQTYTPIPASTTHYLSYMKSQFGVAHPAFAQQNNIGFGFGSINFLLKIWTTFRNIVYLLFVLLFVVVGVLIMLRVKIDPRTVMTIENQIPNLIVGLILVTFSFAIAGLLIDLMWVGTYLVINVFGQVDPEIGKQVNSLARDVSGGNPIGIANNYVNAGTGGLISIIGNGAGAISSAVTSLLSGDIGRVIAALIGAVLGSIAGGLSCGLVPHPAWVAICTLAGGRLVTGITTSTGAAAGWFSPEIVGFIAYILVSIILFVALLWALFRLWFSLISAYVYTILHIVLSPFWVLLGILPGSQINFEAWLREMISNLVSFPATIALLLMAKVFMDSFKDQPPSTTAFVPPLIGDPGQPSQIGAIIAMGILLLTPKIVSILKEALRAPQFKYATAIGEAIGVGMAHGGRLARTTAEVGLPYKSRYTGKEVGFIERIGHLAGFVR